MRIHSDILRNVPTFALRLWFRLTGSCLDFRPDHNDVCIVCRWTRPANSLVSQVDVSADSPQDRTGLR